MGRGEPDTLEPRDVATRAKEAGERALVTELDAVRVHVLAEQRHLDRTLGHERFDLREDLAGRAVSLLASQ